MPAVPDFYSHAPRGARLRKTGIDMMGYNFYSHAPRGARPYYGGRCELTTKDFYSHAPRGARPWTPCGSLVPG